MQSAHAMKKWWCLTVNTSPSRVRHTVETDWGHSIVSKCSTNVQSVSASTLLGPWGRMALNTSVWLHVATNEMRFAYRIMHHAN
jgi:hypothetical protein